MLFLLFVFFSAFFSFAIQSKHLMKSLLSLEMMVLSLVFFCFLVFTVMILDFLIPLVVLVLGASEASIGLSILVTMTSKSGSDTVSNSLLKC
uniref:NADH-ubiquinone oxidoreductase chain 4L n=1 Tax=Scutopus robustus TaxID=2109553 RepID=A0A343YNC1_9MOLL|nr:NADH dehydrogenase subunit 4L [Scutopus robustus]AWL21428.1 NADH dehydrogenase subunit 4L [Scutopus robustus]